MVAILLAIIGLSIWQTPNALPTKDAEYTVERANNYIAQNKNSVNQTYRLKYHFVPPIGWINDPNGFIYFRGEYHLFYQYNPYDSVPKKIHWGHAKSKDLVHWEDLPVALAPDQDYDNDGVFSGSAIVKDEKLYVMYTGNTDQRQVQCIAVSEDGINFKKVPENPVLDAKDLPPNAKPQDFRDPKVFQRGNTYYVVLVSKTLNETGQALLYESPDLINWKFKSILLEGERRQGIMWECPDLYELDGKDVLVLSPIQMPTAGNEYQNIDSVIEFVGKVDWDKGTFKVETTKEIDHGLDFYATQSLLDDKNRRIVIAWMAMWGRDYPTNILKHGWAGAMTLPRELHVKNGRLTQTPVTEITKMYQDPVKLANVILNNEIKEFDKVAGEVGVLELTVDLGEVTFFKIELRANENENTILSYDTYGRDLTLDRGDSGIFINGDERPALFIRQVEAPLKQNKLKLQVFLDQSSVEVFVNDGEESMTATIYPTEPISNKIRFSVEGKAVIDNLYFASIKP